MVVDILRRIYDKTRVLIWNTKRGFRCMRRVSGVGSMARVMRLVIENSLLAERDEPPARSAIAVRAYGQDVWLRPRSTDLASFDFSGWVYHLPPPDIAPPIEHIGVFGANVGSVLIDLAARYPTARLLGVEPEPENAVLARRNVAPLGDRCTFVEAAVWWEDAELEFRWTQDAWGFNLSRNVDPGERAGGSYFVKAVDAGALLDEFTRGQPVDFLFVNIETAWYEMLHHGEWTRSVRSLKVEIVDHFDEAVPLLESLGYQAHLQRLYWGAYAVGRRA
jgi:FkbM family methyltransferase